MTKKIPLRQCVGCREMKSKKELIRVIKTKDSEVLLDSTGKMNGRGAYVCNNVNCFENAIKTKAFDRALGIVLTEDVLDKLKKEFS